MKKNGYKWELDYDDYDDVAKLINTLKVFSSTPFMCMICVFKFY